MGFICIFTTASNFYSMKTYILSLIALLVLGIPIQAQQNSFFTHYSSEDGLSQNTVMSTIQDHKGNLWFATWDGLNRFNGYSFKSYKARQGSFVSLTNNRVDRISEDKYGYLWLMTYDNRVHRFDPRTETFERVPAAGEPGSSSNVHAIQVLPQGTVWLFTEGDGGIRVTTNPKDCQLSVGLFSKKAGTFPADTLLGVHLDKEGNEWMLTNRGLGMIRSGSATPVRYFEKQSFYAVQELDKEIYFGSNRGHVWCYQKDSGQFYPLLLPTTSHIAAIGRITPEKLVIATATDGFFIYETTTKKHKHYSRSVYKDLSANPIRSVYVDKASEVWFEQEESGVVVHFNPTTHMLKREQIRVEPTNTDRSRPAFHIHEDVNGTLWVHPYGGGFSSFNRKENRLVPFHNELGSSDWKFSNKIHSAFSDAQGNLWLCTHSKGLEKITFRSVQFNMLTPASNSYESLSNEVRALCEDRHRNLWVGVKDGMLRVYDSLHHYKGFLTEDGRIAQSGTPMQGNVYSILQDSKGTMWLATKGSGLVRAREVSPSTYQLTRYTYDAHDTYSISNDNIYSIHEDHCGRIWVATYANGINYITQDEQGRTRFISHRNQLKGYPIDLCYKARFITSDNNGRLWVGTTAGAVAFDEYFKKPEEIRFDHFARIPDDTRSLSNNDVHYIYSTRKKELYIATFGGGLNKLVSIDKDGHGIFNSYSVQDGLPSDVLLTIQEDRKQNLWFSTENGISKFIPSEERFENYDDRSITFRVRFSEAASAMTSSGELVYGASNGVFFFHPDSIKKSRYVPAITFSKLVVANLDAVPGAEGSVLKVGIDDTEELVLSHTENIFSIQYAALDYTNPQNILYAYKLEGFDKEWMMTDKQRNATYTNLPKGRYVFKVRSTNSDGEWVENTRELPIVVLPSFWETPLAYLLYVLFILLIILVAVYILFTIYRLKHEVSVEQQVSDIKLRFFTNISHELRTPLTLIAGPVEQVLENNHLPADVREQLVVVERNTSRMLRLVNQILDFRKIQNKKMKMQVERIDTVLFVRKIMDNFEALATEHQIDFVFQTEKESLFLWVDADKFEKIVFNLLSNAFKYTSVGKQITVYIREEETTVAVGVQDQGVGIADSRKKSLFIRFENLVDKNLFNQESTGIGLSLVKELVEMHRATIKVDSELGEGSCFEVDFRKGKEHYDETVEMILNDADGPKATPKLTPEVLHKVSGLASVSNLATTEQPESGKEPSTSKELMLLVEDNQELRSFLRSIFVSTYAVIEAADGQDGYDKALTCLPDIIISDVMMPLKDGIELTKELRDNSSTSHIPIILLTAKTAIESKLEGLEYGADDYITKPFSAMYLKARVENLLALRRKLQRFYRDNLLLSPPSSLAATPAEEQHTSEEEQPLLTISPNDRKFMDKLVELMEKNMDNGDLVVDDLVGELAVSRSVFFKKLKTLTGLAPIEFIKEMRIKRAAQLIETGEFNMTQISYMVGINDPRYFSKCFKSKFGITPTEYKDRLGK